MFCVQINKNVWNSKSAAGLSFCYIWIAVMGFSSSSAVGKVDWQLVLLGRAESEHRVRARGQELTHQERTKGKRKGGKRKVIWEEGTWITDTWRWRGERGGKGRRR